MKNFIKNKLRLILEGRLGTHTPTNPYGEALPKDANIKGYERGLANLVKYKNIYSANGGSGAYGDVYHGDGLYQVDVSFNGDIRTVQTHRGKEIEAGDYNTVSGVKMSIFVKACRGVEHPDLAERTCNKVGASPGEDAAVKASISFMKEIKDFLKGSVDYTSDGSGAEIAAAKNSPELAAKVAGKMDLLDKQTDRAKTLAPDIKSLVRQKEELVNRLQSLKGNDKSVRVDAKKVRDEIKLLTKKIKELEYKGSSKDDYLKSKNK